jgi:Flp pilus assembly protein TadG
MRLEKHLNLGVQTERGSTLFIVAASLVALLLLAGLAIDLGWLYVGRTEAQRAADAAALAGAEQFVSSTFTSGGVTQGEVTTLADNAAVTTAELNKVGGQTLVATDITAGPPDFSRSGNPLITVQVTKSLPTFFMKIFGWNTITVGASATAEAYDPGRTGTGPTFCASCLKPFLVPNCDPDHTVSGSSASANSLCETASGKTCSSSSTDCQSYFLNSSGTPVNPGVSPSGVVGETWTLHTSAAPSQWYEIAFDGSQSGANFRTDVEQCDTNQINCGTQLQTLDGKKVGPNDQAICDLITYSTGKCNGAQSATSVDSITFNASNSPPYTITAGGGNPYFASGTQIGRSASMITVPVYNGADLSSGGSTVTVVGYLQMFVTGFDHHGNDDQIFAQILGVTSCGETGGAGCGSTTGGTVSGGGASFIPVRLVQHP